MAGPIVYVDRSEVVEGRLDELTTRIDELAHLVEASEPGLIAYAVYLDNDHRAMSVVHIHRDAESLATHFRVAGPAFRNFVELVRLQSIDLYGDPTDDIVKELGEKARLLGNATVAVHPRQAGFLRLSDAPAGGVSAAQRT
jgi:quinol monooxygenase YgiN